MPLVADRVKETSTTTGTGTLTLAGAPTGFQTFSTAFGTGQVVYYVIDNGAEWEIGIGTTGTGTLSRDTVLQSTNGDALVPLSAGEKTVFCAYVADRAVTTSDEATLTNKVIDSITNHVGSDHIHYKVKATTTITKGQALKAVGYSPGELAIDVAPVSSASDVAVGIAYVNLNTGEFGPAINTGLVTNVKTDYAGWAIGDILYPDPATGGLTKTKPTSGLYQACAYVMRVNANVGVLLVEFTEPQYVAASTNTANTLVLRDGSGNFSAGTVTAALTGNASTATTLQTARNINGVSFNGSADITITAANPNALTLGSGLTGTSYDGSAAVTATVDATDASTASKIVSRDASGISSFKAVKLDGTTSGTVTVQPAATAGTWSLTLPTNDGDNGQVLTTDGSGVTSWQNPNSQISLQSTGNNTTFYPLIYNASTGTTGTLNVDTTFTFNPFSNQLDIGGPLTASSISMSNGAINSAYFRGYTEQYGTVSISSGTLTLDLLGLNTVFRCTRNANISTINITNAFSVSNAAQSFTLIFNANGSSYTITWPSSVKWPGGTAPTITTTNGRSDMFVFYTNNAGTTWYAMTAAQNFVTT